MYLVSFTSSFASLAPQEFVDQYLVAFHSQVVVAGYDHTYGPADIATMDRLPGYAQGHFEVVTVPKFTDGTSTVKVGSRAIRQLIDTETFRRPTRSWAIIIRLPAWLSMGWRGGGPWAFRPLMSRHQP